MAKITRRGFLGLAGVGAAGAALAKVGMDGAFGGGSGSSIQFVAVGPMPPAKVSPMATLVVRGHATAEGRGSGQVTTQVFPGSPATSDAPVPGMTKVGSVEAVELHGSVRLSGRIENVAQPSRSVRGPFEITIDPAARVAYARIQGVEYRLEVTEYRAG